LIIEKICADGARFSLDDQQLLLVEKIVVRLDDPRVPAVHAPTLIQKKTDIEMRRH